MHRPVQLCFLMLLVVSCEHPKRTASWAGSRETDRVVLMQRFPQVSPQDALLVYPDVDENLVRASWPSTLDQAVTRLIADMDDADRKMVRDSKQEDLILFHHGWGTAIRNEFGLRRGNTELLADCHSKDPDDASMLIIQSVWKRLQEQ